MPRMPPGNSSNSMAMGVLDAVDSGDAVADREDRPGLADIQFLFHNP
jgi:hypothetical protein